MNKPAYKIIFYTSIALFGFAGNAVFCRLALNEQNMDAASFTVIRLLSGIIVLMLIVKLFSHHKSDASQGSWLAGLMLFVYAATFSYAYVSLETGVGALVLFSAVQITMIVSSFLSGHTLCRREWIGLILAFFGFVYLVFPSLTTPSISGFLLMTIAGIAWAIYSLLGQSSTSPFYDTAANFMRTSPLVLLLLLFTWQQAELSLQGVLFAVMSGAVASALGYTIWYMALGGLSTTQAAVLQLLVPVIATVGGVLFAQELITLHFIFASLMILGGILVVIFRVNRI